MKQKIFISFLLILNVSLYSQQMDRASDLGYRFYQSNQYDKAIEYWMNKIPDAKEPYKTQASYLVGLSHLELVSLYLLASEIVPNIALVYYDFLTQSQNIDKTIVNIYKAINLVELGRIKEASVIINGTKYGGKNNFVIEQLKITKDLIANKLNNKTELITLNNTYVASQGKKSSLNSNRNIFIDFLNKGDIKSADLVLSKMNLNEPDYTDRSVKSREIRFYNPNIYSLLLKYNLLKAENIFLALSDNPSQKISIRANKLLSKIYFLLGDKGNLKSLSLNFPNDEVIQTFYHFLNYSNNKDNNFIKNCQEQNDSDLKSEIGYYLIRFKLNINVGTKLIYDAFRSKQSKNNVFYYGYSQFKKESRQTIAKAEEILNEIYTRSRTTDFSKNKPLYSLLYSYVIYKKLPGLSCPESIDIAQLLARNFQSFNQYHNSVQGMCLFYSTLGEGEVKFEQSK